MSKSNKAIAVGIDLGTTYSCVAVWFDQHNRVEIIPTEQGNNVTPSCVACNETELLVGESAKNQITRNPTNTVFGKLFDTHNIGKYLEPSLTFHLASILLCNKLPFITFVGC